MFFYACIRFLYKPVYDSKRYFMCKPMFYKSKTKSKTNVVKQN